MKVITEPQVHLLSASSFFPHPKYELPPAWKGGTRAEGLIATAGKVCYDSYGVEGNPIESHVRNLVKSGHLSVVEHVHVGLFIEGISRGCSHEIVRHRMFNYSQRSTRYTKEDDAAIVLDPYYASLPADDDELTAFLEATRSAIDSYPYCVATLMQRNPKQLASKDLRKWARGKARQLLPHALETRMVMTGNLRAWRHFLIMRTSRHAEAEIRRLAHAIWHVVQPIAPNVFCDLNVNIVDDYAELTAP
jgi:thymidylate synthase (FAD)